MEEIAIFAVLSEPLNTDTNVPINTIVNMVFVHQNRILLIMVLRDNVFFLIVIVVILQS